MEKKALIMGGVPAVPTRFSGGLLLTEAAVGEGTDGAPKAKATVAKADKILLFDGYARCNFWQHQIENGGPGVHHAPGQSHNGHLILIIPH